MRRELSDSGDYMKAFRAGALLYWGLVSIAASSPDGAAQQAQSTTTPNQSSPGAWSTAGHTPFANESWKHEVRRNFPPTGFLKKRSLARGFAPKAFGTHATA
jgi:hypothetical protein